MPAAEPLQPATETEHVDRVAAEERATVARAGEAEGALVTEGQRRVNLIWERVQAILAISVVETALLAAMSMILGGATEAKSLAFTFLASTCSLVIGFYFGRTNHARTGGIGGEFVSRER